MSCQFAFNSFYSFNQLTFGENKLHIFNLQQLFELPIKVASVESLKLI